MPPARPAAPLILAAVLGDVCAAPLQCIYEKDKRNPSENAGKGLRALTLLHKPLAARWWRRGRPEELGSFSQAERNVTALCKHCAAEGNSKDREELFKQKHNIGTRTNKYKVVRN